MKLNNAVLPTFCGSAFAGCWDGGGFGVGWVVDGITLITIGD
jgi:hypothetical protein